jgi:hypothetical protein
MRYLVGFVLAVAVVASPRGVTAQADEIAETSAQKGPYYVEPPRFNVQASRNGLIASSVILGAGAALTAGMLVRLQKHESDTRGRAAGLTTGFFLGVSMTIGGIVGLGISARRFRVAKRDRELQSARLGSPRTRSRVQWDLTRSRLVF